jgi:hypothetical protein
LSGAGAFFLIDVEFECNFKMQAFSDCRAVATALLKPVFSAALRYTAGLFLKCTRGQ